jgi:hypothetical protein
MKTNLVLGGCVVIAVVGFAARSGAQTPDEGPCVGDPGHWAISVERAFRSPEARPPVGGWPRRAESDSEAVTSYRSR